MNITWNTDVNAPCCPGEIVAEDGRTILIRDGWGCPGVAATFGWNKAKWQIVDGRPKCDHRNTDGTVDCPDCSVPAHIFMEAAREYLDNHNGATADDPGYFGGIVATRQGKSDSELAARKGGEA